MRKHPQVRYVRILVTKNGIPAWFTPTLRVRQEGRLLSGELTVHEFEAKCQEAAQLYGNANIDIADSGARSWNEAEYFFNSQDVKSSDSVSP